MDQAQLAERLKNIKQELCSVTLIAVTKYSALEDLEMAYAENQFDFGESKVNDLKYKANYFQEKNFNNVRWHFIGHLQTNKVKELLRIPNLSAIHSVDSLRLLKEIIKNKSEFTEVELKIFLQLNTSHEDEKTGFTSMLEFEEAVELLQNTNGPLKLAGLMTMGSIRTEDFELSAKKCFSELEKVREQLIKKYKILDLKLSMGMSQDYKIALTYGTDFVRIGSALFK